MIRLFARAWLALLGGFSLHILGCLSLVSLMRLVCRGLRADVALSEMLSWWLGWGLGGDGF